MCYIALSFSQITNCENKKPKAMQLTTNHSELYDIDKLVSSNSFRAAQAPGEWVEISLPDFVGWLFETGRIDNYHTAGAGMVEMWPGGYMDNLSGVMTARRTVVYSFQEFLTEVVDDELVISYLKSQDGFEAWVARATAQAAPARPAQEYTPEQQAQMWAEYYDYDDYMSREVFND